MLHTFTPWIKPFIRNAWCGNISSKTCKKIKNETKSIKRLKWTHSVIWTYNYALQDKLHNTRMLTEQHGIHLPLAQTSTRQWICIFCQPTVRSSSHKSWFITLSLNIFKQKLKICIFWQQHTGWHDRSWTISISNISLLLTVTCNSFISFCI